MSWIPAALALVLCVLGIYGSAAFAATERTLEIGIHLAVGAQPSDVIRLLLTAIARPLAGGVIAGVALAAVLGFLMKDAELLVDVPPIDPLSYGAACLAVTSAALVATLIPARRAARLDPWQSLRSE